MEQLNLFSFFQDLKVGFYHKKKTKGLKIPHVLGKLYGSIGSLTNFVNPNQLKPNTYYIC